MKKIAMVVMVCCLFFVSLGIAGDKVVYTVKKGDTLGELMYAWRVQGVEIEKLYSWNPNLGTQIKVGQEIVYNLPDRPEAKKLSEQEVKKIVSETMAQMEALKVPAVASKTEAPLKNRLGLYILMAVVVVIFLLAWAWFSRMNKEVKSKPQTTTEKPGLDKFPKTHLSEIPIVITIMERNKWQDYEFYPEVAEDGRFKTFNVIDPDENPARYRFVRTEKELRKSLRSSFKDETLVQSLYEQRRLRLPIFP